MCILKYSNNPNYLHAYKCVSAPNTKWKCYYRKFDLATLTLVTTKRLYSLILCVHSLFILAYSVHFGLCLVMLVHSTILFF